MTCLANDLFTRKTQKFLRGSIDEHITKINRILHNDGYRNVFNNDAQELTGAASFVLGALACGNIDGGHQGCGPTSVVQRSAIDGHIDQAAIRFDVSGNPTFLISAAALRNFPDPAVILRQF